MCKAGHQLYQGGGNTRFEFPAQLLYVSGGQDGTIEKPPGIVKLVQTSAMDADIECLALSHCWGKIEAMGFKLVASSIDACFKDIEFGGLSNNLKS